MSNRVDTLTNAFRSLLECAIESFRSDSAKAGRLLHTAADIATVLSHADRAVDTPRLSAPRARPGRPPLVLTKHQQAMVDAYRKGESGLTTLRQLAAQLGCSTPTARRLVRQVQES